MRIYGIGFTPVFCGKRTTTTTVTVETKGSTSKEEDKRLLESIIQQINGKKTTVLHSLPINNNKSYLLEFENSKNAQVRLKSIQFSNDGVHIMSADKNGNSVTHVSYSIDMSDELQPVISDLRSAITGILPNKTKRDEFIHFLNS